MKPVAQRLLGSARVRVRMIEAMRGPVVVLVLAMALPAQAAEVSATRTGETALTPSLTNEPALTASERVRLRAWQLSTVEWHRYQQLMQGVRGSVSPATISPVEVLGIHARDAGERRRYAERWARILHEDVERILAFQRAYDAANRRLYPDEPLIDLTRLPVPDKKPGTLQPGDRVLFFTRTDCPACDVLLQRLLKRLERVAGLDIYITGMNAGSDAAIRDWAARHGIDPAWVHSRRITLNHEAGALERLTRGRGEIPYVMRRRGQDLSAVRAAEL